MASGRPIDAANLSALSSLDDPLRRSLYEYVRDADTPVSREQIAVATKIGRTLAAYHLDKLVDAGLLVAGYQQWPGRHAGRPAKLYRRAEQDVSLSVPPREYELLARLLATAVQVDASGTVRTALHAAARQAGADAVEEVRGDLIEALRGCGYQPRHDSDGCIELRNCPFHALARDYLDVVCGLNLHLIRGVIEASAQSHARAELEPRAGRCCVVVHDTASADEN